MSTSQDADILRQALDNLVESIQDATSDGRLTLPELWRIAGRINETAVVVAEMFSDRQGHYDELAEGLERIYDEYVATVDIWLIPDKFEQRYIHPWVRGQIRPWVAAVYEVLGE